MIFCSNCDSEALWKITHHDNKGVVTPMCDNCRIAYEWGQASPDSSVEEIGDGDPDPEEKETYEGDEPVLPEFTVIDYLSMYAIRQNSTGKEYSMGDGVDVLQDEDGKSIMCGTEEFRQQWEDALNADAASTREAYFPEGDDDDA